MSLEDLAAKHPAVFGPVVAGLKELNGRLEAAHAQMVSGIIKAMEIAPEGNLDPRDVEMQLTQSMRQRVGHAAMGAMTYAFAEARQSRPDLFTTDGKTRYNPAWGEPA
jgi:hypothetical protein